MAGIQFQGPAIFQNQPYVFPAVPQGIGAPIAQVPVVNTDANGAPTSLSLASGNVLLSKVVGQAGTAVGIAPTGTVGTGSSGNWTSGTAFNRVYGPSSNNCPGIWLYLGAVASTPALAAGYYWLVMSSAAVGTIYQGGPGSQPYNFSAGAANTGTTTETQLGALPAALAAAGPNASLSTGGIVLLGNSLLANGFLSFTGVFSTSNSANTKTMRAYLAGTNFAYQQTTTSASDVMRNLEIRNAGATNSQVNNVNYSPGGAGSTSTLTYSSVDTTQNQYCNITGACANATDFIVLESYSLVANPG